MSLIENGEAEVATECLAIREVLFIAHDDHAGLLLEKLGDLVFDLGKGASTDQGVYSLWA